MIAPLPTVPVAPAAAAGTETLDALTAVFVLFIAAKVGEEVFRRLGQPGVVGELVGGFVVGPYALGLVTPDQVTSVLAELGVVILLFAVGLTVRVDDLLAVGKPALASAVLAMVLPIVTCGAAAALAGQPPSSAVFVGLALAATSIGVTSRVLAELGVLGRRFSRVILGAAIADDVLALVLIGIVTGFAKGDLSASTIVVAVGGVGVVGLGLLAARRARGLPREVFTWPRIADSPLVPAFILMLAAALLAARLGLAAIVGAFIVGLIIAETGARKEVERDLQPLELIFVPFFFATTGAAADLSALGQPDLAALAVTITVVGVITKIAGGLGGAISLGRSDALVVGIGLVPRGEVGIIVADLGLTLGVLDERSFGVVLVAVVATTLVAPVLLRWAIERGEGSRPSAEQARREAAST